MATSPGGQVIGRVSIRVLPDTSQFRSRAKADLEKIEKSLTLQAKVELDNASLRRTKQALDRWRKGISPVKVMVRPDVLAGSTALVAARLAAATRPRTVQIIPVINQPAMSGVLTALAALSGARVAADWIERLTTRLQTLDKSVPYISAVTLAISGLSGWGLAAVSNLAALSAALASIGNAALLLPGILSGLAIGIGTTIAALRDFNQVVPQFSTSMAQLQNAISANFWAQAAQPIRELIDTLLPQFSAGLQDTATQLGGWFAGLANSMTGVLDGAIEGMFADLAESIAIATDATGPLVELIRTFGELGAGYLPRFAQWFVDITTSFSDFMSAAAEDGRLHEWVETALENMQALGSFIASLGSALSGIASAATAAGGSTLTMLADTMERVAAVINGPAFQGALTAAFEGAHAAMSAIATNAGPQFQNLMENLAYTIGEVMPVAGEAIGVAIGAIADALADPSIMNGIADLIGGLRDGIAALAPAMAPLGQAVGALGSALGTFASALGPLLGSVIEALAPVLEVLINAIEPLLPILGGALVQAVQVLAPLLTMVGDALGQLLTAVTPLIPVILDLVMAVLTPLAGILSNILAAILPPLIAAMLKFAEAVTPLLELLGTVVGWLLDALGPAIEWIAVLILEGFVMALDGLASVFSGVFNFIMGIWETFAGLFTGDWSRMWEGVKQLFTGIWEIIKGAFMVFLNIGLFGTAKKILTGVFKFFKSIWDDILRNVKVVWDGMKAAWKTFLDNLKNAPGKALQHIKDLFANAWAGIQLLVEAAWNAIKKFFVKGIENTVDNVKKLPGRVLDALKSFPTLLVNIGRRLIEGLIKGIKDMFGSVKDTLGNLTQKLTDWKGPAERDRKLLTGAGRYIIEGLIAGMESRYEAVRRSLRGLSSDIGSEEFALPGMGGAAAVASRLADQVAGAVGEGRGVTRVINYYAAPGSSLGSEEDLFRALDRGRAVGW